MKNEKIKIGIIGGAGYTGGELIRLLINHPQAEISFVHSRSNPGKLVSEIHTDLIGETQLKCTNELKTDVAVIFLCLGHGESSKWMNENQLPEQIHIIDLSQDFRIATYKNEFVYGLPEFQKEKIASAKHIANPGCFATAIQLALLPLAKKGMLTNEIQVAACTGSTGAGQSLNSTSHFTWRFGNHSTYKMLEHQHLNEIGQTLSNLHENNIAEIYFIPQRGAFTRGIHATIHCETTLTQEEVFELYCKFYEAQPFTFISKTPIDLKQVINTNKCLLHVQVIKNRIVITAAIDNLLKGASGQAVQNMNILFGLEETTGLKLKPLAY